MRLNIGTQPQEINKSRLTVHVPDTRNRNFSFSIANRLQHSGVFHLMGDYTRGSNNYVQETILKLHHEPDLIMNNTLKMDLTCPTLE